MNRAFAAVATLSLVAMAVPAVAQKGCDITVTYDNHDLDTAKGQKATECLAYARNSAREYVAAAIASGGKGG
ncbi:UrcA family protein [Qipengyuania sp. G39]|uniref:UrcA family protein n=1 Tax=Qipengyuania profundimaris TaxID=3067652 RepID=A0ABT9HKW6_9SPHN|nr:UrcA family protein [Qipengyuania sp. G39]MDP4573794.1 UrcA family protein [Qipengyuania sp. G39]